MLVFNAVKGKYENMCLVFNHMTSQFERLTRNKQTLNIQLSK